MRPSAEPDDRLGVSGFREDPTDRPPIRATHNLALAPRIRHAAESDGRRDFSRFRECPNQPAVSQDRLILGLSPRSGIVFADFRIFQTHRPLISLSHQVCDLLPTPKIDRISRDSAKIINDRSSIRVAGFRGISHRSGLIFAGFRTFQTRRPLISPSRQECAMRPTPTVGGIPRDFAKILTDRPSFRAA